MPWKLTVLGRTFNTEDLTVGEAETLEDDLGCSWLMISPRASIKHYRALAAVFLAREMTFEAANEKVRALPLNDLGDIEKVEDSRPTLYEDGVPKAGGGPPTSGSSPATGNSGGPRT